MTRKTLFITGAAGGIATHLRRELAGRYQLRLCDLRPISDLKPHEEFVAAALEDLPALEDAMRGADAVLHLGGLSMEGPWDEVLPSNIEGGYNTFEAAHRAGVRRFLFASSNHAVGFYKRTHTINHEVALRPDSRYGVSKAFGELLGRLYADKYGMDVLCLRIGNVNVRPLDERRLALWLSPRDMAQLVTIGVEHPDIRFEVVYGVSGNRRSWYDNRNAHRLGYRPLDDSETFALEVIAGAPEEDPCGASYQGGAFVHEEAFANPAPLPGRRPARKGSGA
ncbi:NAD-dependent epimerase/dehydratase family protein [Paraburkholderia phenazinium]|uniref:Uronate dehydrogenase n=1 Tax=Paraburkholderia phenazinium TaxID=60549 RepID=A0A1N6HYQ1_9BURK|nr:NAD(P)-dependent oxidoreductase [Paraburkholderia phenazinium]SIO24943.1 uronate dehydrogenase [Paraburkholderia phenazinium]